MKRAWNRIAAFVDGVWDIALALLSFAITLAVWAVLVVLLNPLSWHPIIGWAAFAFLIFPAVYISDPITSRLDRLTVTRYRRI